MKYYQLTIKESVTLQVRSRGLPDDLEGPVRIVTIEGLEDDMCCGTHVANLSHLQVRYTSMVMKTNYRVQL